MNTHNAKQILVKSINNLISRRGQITISDVEAETINNACLFILQNFHQEVKSVHDVTQIDIVLPINFMNFENICNCFVNASRELFPDDYDIESANVGKAMILQNISWSGMLDFLRDYFQKNHGIQIDKIKTASSIFYSTNHKRYENGYLVSENDDEKDIRVVNLNFIDNKKELLVSIEPSLSPKNSYLIIDDGSELVFRGYDDDYLFKIKLDDFGEVEQFTLEMPKRNLKIIYFE